MQYIDNLYLSRLLEKSGKSQGISCGLEIGHPVSRVSGVNVRLVGLD